MNKFNWKEKREKKAFLAFEDGFIIHGYSIGAPIDRTGEVVFNTGITGYQEILSDPSYAGQIVIMTYPEIGSVGINRQDMESRQFFANGFIINSYNEASNWRSQNSLRDELIKNNIPCIAGIDTRALTIKIRNSGTLKALISCSGKVKENDAVQIAIDWCGLDGQDYAQKVSSEEPYLWDDEKHSATSWSFNQETPICDINIVALDYGIKYNILRSLRLCGMNVRVLPALSNAQDILKIKPDGLFISNGPADPAALKYAVNTIRELIGKIPIFGICLGHQLLGLASGASTKRLKFGHHGCNHPVMRLENKKVEITSQNHNFVLYENSIDRNIVEITHINLNDNTIEGIKFKKEPAFSVQYHPEAGPGPHDPSYLFNDFRNLILNS